MLVGSSARTHCQHLRGPLRVCTGEMRRAAQTCLSGRRQRLPTGSIVQSCVGLQRPAAQWRYKGGSQGLRFLQQPTSHSRIFLSTRFGEYDGTPEAKAAPSEPHSCLGCSTLDGILWANREGLGGSLHRCAHFFGTNHSLMLPFLLLPAPLRTLCTLPVLLLVCAHCPSTYGLSDPVHDYGALHDDYCNDYYEDHYGDHSTNRESAAGDPVYRTTDALRPVRAHSACRHRHARAHTRTHARTHAPLARRDVGARNGAIFVFSDCC